MSMCDLSMILDIGGVPIFIKIFINQSIDQSNNWRVCGFKIFLSLINWIFYHAYPHFFKISHIRTYYLFKKYISYLTTIQPFTLYQNVLARQLHWQHLEQPLKRSRRFQLISTISTRIATHLHILRALLSIWPPHYAVLL